MWNTHTWPGKRLRTTILQQKETFIKRSDTTNHPWRFLLSLCYLPALLLIPACTLNKSSDATQSGSTVSIATIQENFSTYKDQLVMVKGYGVIMMTAPLCPGYTGMDTRQSFVDDKDNSIYAVVAASASGAERSDDLREFQGYVRIFNGEIGCPGSLQTVTFPYLEIVAIK